MARKNVAQSAAEKVAIRERCRKDKLYLSQQLGYDFQESVHGDLFNNYISYDDSLAWDEQSCIKNRLILWSRGFYKTSSVEVEVVQAILNFPDIRILLMQGTVNKTKELLAKIKSHFDGTNFRSKLKDIFPERCQTDKRLGDAHSFIVPGRTRTITDPTVKVASPKTTKAGQHYDAGFFDDLVNDQNFRNSYLLQKTIDDFNLYTPLIDPGGYKFVTGTRYAFGDLYEWILRQNTVTKEWTVSQRPCWYVKDGELVSYFPHHKLEDGRTVGISVEQLKAIQVSDSEMFAAQYLNQPISTSMHLFPQEAMLKHVRSPEQKDYPALSWKTLFVDLAQESRTKYTDDCVVMCGQQDSMNRVFITDGVGGQWSSLSLANVIIEQALKHRPIKIYIEDSAAGRIFVDYLKIVAMDKKLNLPLDFIKVNTQKGAKHMRISACAGVLHQDKLFFIQGLPCWEKLMDQATGYPQKKHDDYIDTVALACEHYQATNPLPKVRSLASYLTGPEPSPIADFLTKVDSPANQMGGSMGGWFDD